MILPIDRAWLYDEEQDVDADRFGDVGGLDELPPFRLKIEEGFGGGVGLDLAVAVEIGISEVLLLSLPFNRSVSERTTGVLSCSLAEEDRVSDDDREWDEDDLKPKEWIRRDISLDALSTTPGVLTLIALTADGNLKCHPTSL